MNDLTSRIQYVIELKFAGLNARLMVNDVEIARGKPADRKIIQQKVNGWLVGGSNDLVLSAALQDAAHPPPLVDLKCLVFRGPMGRQPEESEALARFAERDKAKLPAGSMQQVWSTSFQADPCYGPWRWERGRQIALDQTSAAAVLRVLKSVVDALNTNDKQALLALFRVMTVENVRAYGFDQALIEAQLGDWCGAWTPVAAWAPLLDDYALSIEGRGRLLRVERKDGKPVFTADPRGVGSGPRDVRLAWLEGGWLIVR
jgi:hypothetical protein